MNLDRTRVNKPDDRMQMRRDFLIGAAATTAASLLPGLARGQGAAQMAGRIDVHHHPAPPALAEALSAKNGFFPPLRGWSLQKSQDDMGKAGVSTALLSCAPATVSLGDLEGYRKVVRDCNEWIAKVVGDSKGSFGHWASLPPLTDVDGALREITYSLDTLKAHGIILHTGYAEKYLGDASFAPVYEELNRRRAVVYTHPGFAPCCWNVQPELTPALIELSTETTRSIASLVFSGTAQKFPNIRFIFSHAGGTMPFLIERFDFEANRVARPGLTPELLHAQMRKFYYDTAQAFQAGPMAALRKIVPVSQIVFGSDFPYRTSDDHVKGLADSRMFTAKEMEAINRGNTLRLVPRLKNA